MTFLEPLIAVARQFTATAVTSAVDPFVAHRISFYLLGVTETGIYPRAPLLELLDLQITRRLVMSCVPPLFNGTM